MPAIPPQNCPPPGRFADTVPVINTATANEQTTNMATTIPHRDP